MNAVTDIPQLYFKGEVMDMDKVGTLRDSSDSISNQAELHRRMSGEGYLYLPGYLDRNEIEEVRTGLLERIAAQGNLDERFDITEGVVKPEAAMSFDPDLAQNNEKMDRVLYSGRMMQFYDFFLGARATHFDYTWFRAKTPGPTTATDPHCDIVFMGRGTHDLYTSWVPFGDVPYEMGGLMLLEASHHNDNLRSEYCQYDVDVYCETPQSMERVAQARQQGRELSAQEWHGIAPKDWRGHYSHDAIETRDELGGRWLTAEYRMGDLLVFCMHIMHASSDNQTERIRLSSDSRYQLASEPLDNRWVGENPPTHGIRAKEGMIC